MTVEAFYDELAPYYHLIFPDWEASLQRQAEQLDGLIRERWPHAADLLDAACGVGTQALGLAGRGYRVTGSDLSRVEVERARVEAARRGLDVTFGVADMRRAHDHHGREFDVVLACDNAVPHLLTDDDLLAAFRQFYRCVRPGGGCLLTVRDYDKIDCVGVHVVPYGVRDVAGVRYLVWQVWDFHGPHYDLAMYFVEDRGDAGCTTRVMRSRYYAVGTERLMELLREAGFVDVARLDDRFYQPVLVGRREPPCP